MSPLRTGVLIGTSGIGSAVWHQPALRALAEARGGGQVVLFARRQARAGELFGHEPWLAEAIPFEMSRGAGRRLLDLANLVLSLRRARLDEIWILHNHALYALAAALAGVPARYGFGAGKQRLFLTRRDPVHVAGGGDPFREGVTTPACRRLLALHGVDIAAAEPVLSAPRPLAGWAAQEFAWAPRPWMVFAPGSLSARRRWSPAGFADLARAVQARWGGAVFFVGAPGDAGLVQEIAARLDEPLWLRNLAGAHLTLPQSVALMSLADLFVGNDSAPLNIAAGLGLPSYGLFHKPAHESVPAAVRAVLPRGRAPDAAWTERLTAAQVMTVLELEWAGRGAAAAATAGAEPPATVGGWGRAPAAGPTAAAPLP